MPITDGNYIDLNNVLLHASGIGKKLSAIAVRVYGALKEDSAASPTIVMIKEIGCKGYGEHGAHVKITATNPPPTVYDYYSPLIATKLAGVSRVVQDNIGEASEIQALGYARRILKDAYNEAMRRHFTITAELKATLPERGDTIKCGDHYGVVESYTYSASAYGERLDVSMVDYNSTVLQ